MAIPVFNILSFFKETLNFSPSTSILLNFFFPFIDIRYFFLKFKTSVLSSNRFAKYT